MLFPVPNSEKYAILASGTLEDNNDHLLVQIPLLINQGFKMDHIFIITNHPFPDIMYQRKKCQVYSGDSFEKVLKIITIRVKYKCSLYIYTNSKQSSNSLSILGSNFNVLCIPEDTVFETAKLRCGCFKLMIDNKDPDMSYVIDMKKFNNLGYRQYFQKSIIVSPLLAEILENCFDFFNDKKVETIRGNLVKVDQAINTEEVSKTETSWIWLWVCTLIMIIMLSFVSILFIKQRSRIALS